MDSLMNSTSSSSSVSLFLPKTPPPSCNIIPHYSRVFLPPHANHRHAQKNKKMKNLVIKLAHREWSPSSSSSSKPAAAAAATATADFQKVRIQILDGCHLRISNHQFNYNGEGGEGIGYHNKISSDYHNVSNNNIMINNSSSSTVVPVQFDLPTLHMESLTSSNTNMDGWPFPPFTKIDIVPLQLFGNIDRASGKVELQFKANVCFCAGLYKAPPLVINSVFKTEQGREDRLMMMRNSNSNSNSTSNSNSNSNTAGYNCKLVAVTELDAVNDQYLNSILDLPTTCVIVLNARMTFF